VDVEEAHAGTGSEEAGGRDAVLCREERVRASGGWTARLRPRTRRDTRECGNGNQGTPQKAAEPWAPQEVVHVGFRRAGSITHLCSRRARPPNERTGSRPRK